jgi:tRNA(Ser,Leu) C12 N-acetylase TAN1
MKVDWNVVVSVREHCYRAARRLLRQFGAVQRTDYYNVLALRVDDVPGFLEALREATERDLTLAACLARVTPVTRTFSFQAPEEFERRAQDAATGFLPKLAGQGFYVRMHRRGFHATMSSQHEEQVLDHFLLESLKQTRAPGHIAFTDPDAVLAVETIGPWAGMSLWKREQLQRYPFLRFN